MSKFRKKPVVIEAMQFTPESARDALAFIGSNWWDDPSEHQPAGLYGNGAGGEDFKPLGLWVRTLEGRMNAMPGDWIIKGVKGEFYPCKPDIFAATYEPVDAPAPAPREEP